MSNRLRLSKGVSSKLIILSNNLGLRRNIVARLAISRSLKEPETVRYIEPEDNAGKEFNRSTITGNQDDIFKALIVQHENRRIPENQFYVKYLRNHLERGINLMTADYSKVNSPIEFLLLQQ